MRGSKAGRARRIGLFGASSLVALAATGWTFERRCDLEIRILVPGIVSEKRLREMEKSADPDGSAGRWMVESVEYAFDDGIGWTRAKYGIDVPFWDLSSEGTRSRTRRRTAEAASGFEDVPGIVAVDVVEAGTPIGPSVVLRSHGERPEVSLVFSDYVSTGWWPAP